MFCFLQPRSSTEPTWIKLSATTSVNISASFRLTDFHQHSRRISELCFDWETPRGRKDRLHVCLIKGELPVDVVVHPTNLQICSVFLSMDAKMKTRRQIVADKVKFVSNYLNWQQTILTLTSWIRLTVTISEQVVVNMITNRESRSEGFILSAWLLFTLLWSPPSPEKNIWLFAAGCFTFLICRSRSVCRYTVV